VGSNPTPSAKNIDIIRLFLGLLLITTSEPIHASPAGKMAATVDRAGRRPRSRNWAVRSCYSGDGHHSVPVPMYSARENKGQIASETAQKVRWTAVADQGGRAMPVLRVRPQSGDFVNRKGDGFSFIDKVRLIPVTFVHGAATVGPKLVSSAIIASMNDLTSAKSRSC
jgi:hypothetical protein